MQANTLIENWVKRRKAVGLKQESFAQEAGVSASLIMKLESGHHSNPTYSTIQKIESALARLERERQRPSDGEAA